MDSIPGVQAACSKNRTASLKKWMSVIIGLKEVDKDHHTNLFVWVTYCAQQGKPLNWDDAHTRAVLDSLKESGHGEPLAPAAASGDAPAEPPPAGTSAIGKSVAQLVKDANEEKRKTFASSQGSAHVATKYMLDLDVLDEARTIMVFGGPVQWEHSSWKMKLVNLDAYLAFHIDSATHGSWVASLRTTVQLLRDKPSLKRCGVSVDLSKFRTAPLSENFLMSEDRRCWKIFIFVANLISERHGSMACETDIYPDCLFALLHDSAEMQKRVMEQWKEDWNAFATLKRLNDPALASVLGRSPFNERVNQDFARLARQAEWQFRPGGPIQRKLLKATRCFGQENMIEVSFKESKDHQNRDGTKRSMRYWKNFEILQESGLEERFGFQTLDTSVTIPMEPNTLIREDDTWIFARATETPNHEKLRRITGQTTWHTGDAQARMKILGDMVAVRTLVKRDDLSLASDFWVNTMVPKHQVPHFRC